MPHAELKYSAELTIDPVAILSQIEQIILRHDPKSGECKGRGYPSEFSHHRHFLLALTMLEKPHRDAAFTAALMSDIEVGVKEMISQSCYFSFGLEYSAGSYITNYHGGAK